MGAKYIKMRQVIESHNPNAIYHGVRCPVGPGDIAYISAHPKHPDDIIMDNYHLAYADLNKF